MKSKINSESEATFQKIDTKLLKVAVDSIPWGRGEECMRAHNCKKKYKRCCPRTRKFKFVEKEIYTFVECVAYV